MSDTVVISVQLARAAGVALKGKFSRKADPAVIERAVCDRLRLDRGSRFELTDADGTGWRLTVTSRLATTSLK